jgi:ketosteroid isomerase-like protein
MASLGEDEAEGVLREQRGFDLPNSAKYDPCAKGQEKYGRAIMASVTEARAALILKIFRAVEKRDQQRLFAFYHPDVEFYEAPSLPYGGAYRGLEAVVEHARLWQQTWDPLQPGDRRMEPRVVAADGDEVVVLWRQRAISAGGEALDSPVLALYRICENKLARAQMFHFDTEHVVRFLERAGDANARGRSHNDDRAIPKLSGWW